MRIHRIQCLQHVRTIKQPMTGSVLRIPYYNDNSLMKQMTNFIQQLLPMVQPCAEERVNGLRCWSTDATAINGETATQGQGLMTIAGQSPMMLLDMPQVASSIIEQNECHVRQTANPDGPVRLRHACQKSFWEDHNAKGICVRCWGTD